MSCFVRAGDRFFAMPGKDALLPRLPVGYFTVGETPTGELYFAQSSGLADTGTLYGDVMRRARRILTTFESRGRSTGVLLSGQMGSGKSLLARVICQLANERDVPTIVVNEPWRGEAFNRLLAAVEQPAIVLMDEFEKVYEPEHQEELLTLLDGTTTGKKLFILTVNDRSRVDHHLLNRPGRLYYAIEFDGVTPEFVREYCADNLKEPEHTDQIVKIASLFEAFTFDILKALVEEMNRYGEDPFDALELLNASPTASAGHARYDVRAVLPDGRELDGVRSALGSPLAAPGGRLTADGHLPAEGANGGDRREYWTVQFALQHLVTANAEEGIYEFVNDKGARVTYVRRPGGALDVRHLAGLSGDRHD